MPPGVQVDEKTVFTSDGGLRLERVPEYVAIIGSGYIGLEFSDVYTALGSEVTFIEAMDRIMPTFDPEIARVAERVLIKPRAIDYRTSVFASKVTPGIPGQKPVTIEMIDAKTKELVEVLEVRTQRSAAGLHVGSCTQHTPRGVLGRLTDGKLADSLPDSLQHRWTRAWWRRAACPTPRPWAWRTWALRPSAASCRCARIRVDQLACVVCVLHVCMYLCMKIDPPHSYTRI